MLNALALILVIAGGWVLVVSLDPVRRLIAQLPPGKMRRRWYSVVALTALFILGYLAYEVVFRSRHSGWADLVIPGSLFLGAGLVWATVTLALQTTIDIRRMTLLERENITDPVMGIRSRQYVGRRLDEEFARARRYGLPLSTLLFDIDSLEDLDDTQAPM